MLVTLGEAKLYLKADGTFEDDAIITACLEKAHTLCQAVSRLSDDGYVYGK